MALPLIILSLAPGFILASRSYACCNKKSSQMSYPRGPGSWMVPVRYWGHLIEVEVTQKIEFIRISDWWFIKRLERYKDFVSGCADWMMLSLICGSCSVLVFCLRFYFLCFYDMRFFHALQLCVEQWAGTLLVK